MCFRSASHLQGWCFADFFAWDSYKLVYSKEFQLKHLAYAPVHGICAVGAYVSVLFI